jgi:hypothetical protein
MKNVKNVIKGLLIGCVVVVGCLVSSGTAIAQENTVGTDMVNVVSHYTDSKGNVITNYKDGSYYINSDVEIQIIDKINNIVTINKDGELYSFYCDNTDNYYLSEIVNVTMDQDNRIVDCTVDSEPIVYDGIVVIYADSEVCCVRIGQDVYDFVNEDSSWNVGDKCTVIIQDDVVLEVRPCLS